MDWGQNRSLLLIVLLARLAFPAVAEEESPPTQELPFRPSYWGWRQITPPPPQPGFTLGGQIQMDAAQDTLGSPNADSLIPARNGLGPHPSETSLYLRRGRLLANAQFDEETRIFVQAQFDTLKNDVTLFDVFLEKRLSPGVTLSAGMLKPRFGWEALRAQANLNTIERSDVTEALRPVRDLGINFSLHNDFIQADLGIYTGQDQLRNERNTTKDIVGRLAILPDPHWVVGASWQLGSFTTLDQQAVELPVSKLGLEARYYNQPFAIEAEAFWSQGYNRFSRDNSHARGYTVTGIYEIDNRFDLIVSHDWFDPDLNRSNAVALDNARNARSRSLLGVNYYLDRSTYHRLMVNYEWHSATEGPSGTTGNWRVRYQYRF